MIVDFQRRRSVSSSFNVQEKILYVYLTQIVVPRWVLECRDAQELHMDVQTKFKRQVKTAEVQTTEGGGIYQVVG